jgi:hypothetical protein
MTVKSARTGEKLVRRWQRWFAASLLSAEAVSLVVWADIPVLRRGISDPPPATVSYEDLWAQSAHADTSAAAFSYWNLDRPAQVPAACAKCHSTPGFLSFLGAAGTQPGAADQPVPAGTTIECVACHNAAAQVLDSVTMPSGTKITGLGNEARCWPCHQGQASTVSVNRSLANRMVTDEDAIDASLRFPDTHFAPVAATVSGTYGKGGYQYAGKSYEARSAHVPGMDTCVDCHDPHSLRIRLDACARCHPEVRKVEDLRQIRMAGSAVDYAGDRDLSQGLDSEIKSLQAMLNIAIQTYAIDVDAPIAYAAHVPPYFFVDNNANGVVDPGETTPYNAFTARLFRAAFNYHFSVQDPGAYAHGGKYMIQLLFDSIEDLDPAQAEDLTRDSAGHFTGAAEAWRHWDGDGAVPGGCSQCHSAAGLPFLLREGDAVSQPVSNSLLCTTCHDAIPVFTSPQVKTVAFPSGTTGDTGDPNSNLCGTCHQGRQSGMGVHAVIAGLDPDTVSTKLRFVDVHAGAAAATRLGAQAQGAYEYPGRTYAGPLAHTPGWTACTDCHETHALQVKVKSCSDALCHGFDVCTGCHAPEDIVTKTEGCSPGNCHATASVQFIRKDRRDFDGDGDTSVGLAGEVQGLTNKLYAALQVYAANVAKTPLVYEGHTDPYFFADTNGNGLLDAGETPYTSWTPRLLRTAYNYRYMCQDPGAFAHNGKYVIQTLYDSLADLAARVPVDMTKMVRP